MVAPASCPICGRSDLRCKLMTDGAVQCWSPSPPAAIELEGCWLEAQHLPDGPRIYQPWRFKSAAANAAPVGPAPSGALCDPVVVRLADVQPEPVRWLWPARIALGKLTLIAGDPDLGKSFITLDMAARVSRGTPWPDALKVPNPSGGVVLLSAEDDLADTIRPRLDAAGADVARISALEAVRIPDPDSGGTRAVAFCLTTDLPALEQAIQQTPDCRLVVIDPISAYLPAGGRFDSHRNTDVRAALAPLAALAARYRVAVVAVQHLRKSDGPAMYRAMGSLAFIAAARAAWAVSKDREDPTGRRRLFLPVKNNLSAEQTGLAYVLCDTGNGIPCVAWESEPVNVTADDALAGDRGRAGEDDGDDAAEFLRDALADGEHQATEILKQARTNGFNDKAIRKAFRALGGRRRRAGFGAAGAWYWSLPDAIDAIDAHASEPGNKGNNAAPMGGTATGDGCPDDIRYENRPDADGGAGYDQ